MANELKAFRWPPQQTSRERVGGQLFFPDSRIHKWLETHRTEHLIHRLDIIWGNVFAYKFKHSLAGFYVLKSLQEKYDTPKSSFYSNLHTSIFQDLKQILDHPDVCYALGREYGIYPYFARDYIPESDMKLHKRGKDLKNQFETLDLKSLYVKYNSCRPTEKEFLELASQGYGPAYLKAADMAEERGDLEESERILRKALSAGHTDALLHLASLYEERNQQDKAQEFLTQAGNENIAYSYLFQGIKLVGRIDINNSHEEKEKLKKMPAETIKQAADYFIKSGKARDPKGFRYLGCLNLKLSEFAKTKKERDYLKSQALRAFLDGCTIGGICCLVDMHKMLSGKQFSEIIQEYKLEPYQDFLGYMEQFLSE